jgi:hypothetical protein
VGGGISDWTIILISKNCNKARAIQFLSYLISEDGQMDTFFDIQNDTYTIVNGIPTFTPEVKMMNQTDKNKQKIEISVDYTTGCLVTRRGKGSDLRNTPFLWDSLSCGRARTLRHTPSMITWRCNPVQTLL